eukprot:FR739247.1.p1 GENE.FR739247.1~~FR739247.1.p1  ORF type:complete len:126 (+),score=9.23 FR739247.1:55-378(+)
MAHQHAFVGLTEQMKLSFQILRITIPDFFGMDDIPLDICNKCKNKANATVTGLPKPVPPNERNIEILQRLNSLDLELYEYAKELFWEKAGSCLGVTEDSLGTKGPPG